MGLGKQMLHMLANMGSCYLEGKDEPCSDDIRISLFFFHCGAGNLETGEVSSAQDRDPATAGQKIDRGGCTRLRGAAEDKVVPVRIWEAFKKRSGEREKRRKSEGKRQKIEREHGMKRKQRLLLSLLALWEGSNESGAAREGMRTWGDSVAGREPQSLLSWVSPGSCRASSTQQHRFTEQRGRRQESSRGGRSTEESVRL